MFPYTSPCHNYAIRPDNIRVVQQGGSMSLILCPRDAVSANGGNSSTSQTPENEQFGSNVSEMFVHLSFTLTDITINM